MAPPTRWASSSTKHQISHADALHAMRNASIYIQGFDTSQDPGGPDADLWIGPSRDGSFEIEVFAHLNAAQKDVLIFHVMEARESTRRRAREIAERRNKQ